jgi:CRP-like cAMP-binding protein
MQMNFALPTAHYAALTRLSALAELGEEDALALQAAARASYAYPALRELIGEGQRVTGPSILLGGWAGRVRLFADGRRQILGFVLPGELIGFSPHREPLAATTIIALTDLSVAPAPAGRDALGEAYAVSQALAEFYLFRQVARLGRLSAYERLIDWLLEMRDRLAISGLAKADSFPIPMTQEALADALGLTSVHVNRTLQLLRREGLIVSRGGMVCLPDPARLEELVDYRPAAVSQTRRTV